MGFTTFIYFGRFFIFCPVDKNPKYFIKNLKAADENQPLLKQN